VRMRRSLRSLKPKSMAKKCEGAILHSGVEVINDGCSR
jgi:hypothetical protein